MAHDIGSEKCYGENVCWLSLFTQLEWSQQAHTSLPPHHPSWPALCGRLPRLAVGLRGGWGFRQGLGRVGSEPGLDSLSSAPSPSAWASPALKHISAQSWVKPELCRNLGACCLPLAPFRPRARSRRKCAGCGGGHTGFHGVSAEGKTGDRRMDATADT